MSAAVLVPSVVERTDRGERSSNVYGRLLGERRPEPATGGVAPRGCRAGRAARRARAAFVLAA